ncbi:MAG TPA: PIN domain-containing protein [Thermoanaerobaculia bacterium]|nr:PIN domain-containing protein [Thermoanaerobaculia bacterium]
MKYLLDSNAVISMLTDTRSPVRRQAQRHAVHDIGISTVVLFELYHGALKSRRADSNIARLTSLEFEVLDFEDADAWHAAEIRVFLASKGTPIGPYDLLIAGQARARALTLVTHTSPSFAACPDFTLSIGNARVGQNW